MTALIETMRARGGRVPLIWLHRTRLGQCCAALGLPAPTFWDEVQARAEELGDGVVRVVWNGVAEWSTRAVGTDPVALRVSAVPHVPYPHKTTARDAFQRAARVLEGEEPLLLTTDGLVAETPRFALLWWEEGGALAAVDQEVGTLASVGVARVERLAELAYRRVEPAALAGRPVAVVNAVRGVVPVGWLNGVSVGADARWDDLARRFWPA